MNGVCDGKMSVEIFEFLLNNDISTNIINETICYAKHQNDATFTMNEYDLKCYVDTPLIRLQHCSSTTLILGEK